MRQRAVRLGLFCFLGRGHLNPLAALGRGLVDRGHDVTVFHLVVAQSAVRGAGLKFSPIDVTEPAIRHTSPRRLFRPIFKAFATIDTITIHAERTLKEGPAAVKAAGVEAILGDQLDLAASSVAEALGLPFITLCCTAPTYLDEALPPPYFGWHHSESVIARLRNRCGNWIIHRALRPVLDIINTSRGIWGLPTLSSITDTQSTLAMITQLPEVLEFRRPNTVRKVFYTGPFRDDKYAAATSFPWELLDGRPIVYGSMGTIRNTDPRAFRIIAEACAAFNVQLVLSLGGGALLPADLGSFPGNPIIVHYAPQDALLRCSILTIGVAGLNTSLDSILSGVPIIAIPVAEDQPGVAARLRHARLAVTIPYHRLSVRKLKAAIATVLQTPAYRHSVHQCRMSIAQLNGVGKAVQIIESTLAVNGNCNQAAPS